MGTDLFRLGIKQNRSHEARTSIKICWRSAILKKSIIGSNKKSLKGGVRQTADIPATERKGYHLVAFLITRVQHRYNNLTFLSLSFLINFGFESNQNGDNLS